MKLSFILCLLLGTELVCHTPVRAEIPLLACVVTANRDAPFSDVAPILQEISQGKQLCTIAIGNDPGVEVAIRIREDVSLKSAEELQQMIQAGKQVGGPGNWCFKRDDIDAMRERLEQLGARVVFERVEMFPWSPFSIKAFEAQRAKGKPVVVISRADWCLLSAKHDQDVFENLDVIRQVKRLNLSVLLLDQTTAPDEEAARFAEQHRILVPCVAVFRPNQAAPSRLEDELTKEQFLKLIGISD